MTVVAKGYLNPGNFYTGNLFALQVDVYQINLISGVTEYVTNWSSTQPLFIGIGSPEGTLVALSEVDPGETISYTPTETGIFRLATDSTSGLPASYTLIGGLGRVVVADATTGAITQPTLKNYSGPVKGVLTQYVTSTSDTVTITSEGPSCFIDVLGIGAQRPVMCAINVASGNGNNVLDSYANSSFFTDGSGVDQNYLDCRSLTQNQWDTVVNFHSGDNVTLWGVTPQDFALAWVGDTQGAAGYTGLTGVFVSKAGGANAGVTLAGFHTADLTNGRLTVRYDSIQGTPYASIHAN